MFSNTCHLSTNIKRACSLLEEQWSRGEQGPTMIWELMKHNLLIIIDSVYCCLCFRCELFFLTCVMTSCWRPLCENLPIVVQSCHLYTELWKGNNRAVFQEIGRKFSIESSPNHGHAFDHLLRDYQQHQLSSWKVARSNEDQTLEAVFWLSSDALIS